MIALALVALFFLTVFVTANVVWYRQGHDDTVVIRLWIKVFGDRRKSR